MAEDLAERPEGSGDECGLCGHNKLKQKNVGRGAERRRETEVCWVQCDKCDTWYHTKCVQLEEYEVALIDKYHCVRCVDSCGPSKMRPTLVDHRYAFDDVTQKYEVTQTGTKRFIDEFKESSVNIPLVSSDHLVTLEDGFEFERTFNPKEVWTKVYLIKNVEGLGMKLPQKEFTLKDCVDIVGEDRMVSTIDVHMQESFQMSMGRFYKLFTAEHRPRLYNILSLEFSDTKLGKMIQPPKLVAELSWVHKFWPEVEGKTPVASMMHGRRDLHEHLDSKPSVELFCLAGMKDSYTDFHIDFGGSSVWYHVFKGQKVFYVVEPTDLNVDLFTQYQKHPRSTELFFGDLLPAGTLAKVVINEGETLMIPSGWIHAVWTPCDSLVFGGNFLHSLNIEMQLRIYEEELKLDTEDRFMFPAFELIHWYATASILKITKKAMSTGDRMDVHLERGAKELLDSLNWWIERDKKESDISCSQWVKVYNELKKLFYDYEIHVIGEHERKKNLKRKSSSEELNNEDDTTNGKAKDNGNDGNDMMNVVNIEESVQTDTIEEEKSAQDQLESGEIEDKNVQQERADEGNANLDEEYSEEDRMLESMFSHRSRYGRAPRPNHWLVTKPIVSMESPRSKEPTPEQSEPCSSVNSLICERLHDSCNDNERPAAKDNKHKLTKNVSDIRRNEVSKSKPSKVLTARQRLARKLKIKL